MWCWGSNQGFVLDQPSAITVYTLWCMYIWCMYICMYISPYVLHTVMYIWCVYVCTYISPCVLHTVMYVYMKISVPWYSKQCDKHNFTCADITVFSSCHLCYTGMVAHTCNLSTGETEAEPLRKLGCVSEFCLSKRRKDLLCWKEGLLSPKHLWLFWELLITVGKRSLSFVQELHLVIIVYSIFCNIILQKLIRYYCIFK